MLSPTDAQAEAGKAIAETTGKALDLTKGIGSFIAETIGTIPQDLLELVGGDWLHEKRQRNLTQMQAKTARILEGIDRERISEPTPLERPTKPALVRCARHGQAACIRRPLGSDRAVAAT